MVSMKTKSIIITSALIILCAATIVIWLPQVTGTSQTLWRCTDLSGGFWAPVSGVSGVAGGGNRVFTDPSPPGNSAFYSVLSETP